MDSRRLESKARTTTHLAASVALYACCITSPVGAEPQAAREPEAAREHEPYNLHFQQTTVSQAHPGFHAQYSGEHSLPPEANLETSITSTLFIGVRLWRGAAIHFNPELSGGSGLGGALGVAGFPNGEAFRIGSVKPVIYPARLFLRQVFDFGGDTEHLPDEPNQLAGTRLAHRLTLIAGKFGIADFFDNNTYSHDPRMQFLNWSLMNSAAWDYPADTRGYTYGIALMYTQGIWTLRAAAVLQPTTANGLEMDAHFWKANGLVLENEVRFEVATRPGIARLLLFWNNARAGSYSDALESNVFPPDVTLSRKYSRSKWGFALSLEQEISASLGCFARISWSDGRNETWAFTEVDHSVALGIVQDGAKWSRPLDSAGLALVGNGIAGPHRRYLAAGGLGFILGDGALDYAFEGIVEAYYRFAVIPAVALSPDYQFILHPAYNVARGPVHVFGFRTHVAF